MKTAKDKKNDARDKELELAAKAGVTPEDVKEGESVPEPVKAAQPANPPTVSGQPASPPAAPDKPVNAPAQDEPSAATDGVTQPPAVEPDYKVLYEQERGTRIKSDTANEELRRKFNRELTERQKFELQNRVLQIGAGQGKPAETPPADNGTAENQPAVGKVEEIDASIEKLTAELNDQAGEEISSRVSELSKLHAKREVAASLQGELAKLRNRYDPLVESVQHDIRLNTAATDEMRQTEARKVIAEAHPNWEAIVNSEPFNAWVAAHPMAYQYQMGLQPGDSGMGFAPIGVVAVIAEYVAQDPTLLAEKARLEEAQGREAAAAQDEGVMLATTPVIDNFGEGPKVYRSQFIRQSQELKNNIPALKKLVQDMDVAVASGNFVDDLSRG